MTEWRPGRMEYADNLEDAVSIAKSWQMNGTHRFFRGQVENWPVTPSVARIPKEQAQASRERLARFLDFIDRTPGLKELRNDPDQIIAIAQHYGLPTHFVDFTGDVRIAAFFASYGAGKKHRTGAIIGLDIDRIAVLSKRLQQRQSAIRLVRVHVPDLWRLQAQRGIFLDFPYENLDDLIGVFDRVVFPHSAAEDAGIAPESVYPNRKSELEVLLDYFFANERLISNLADLERTGWVRVNDPAEPIVNVNFDPDILAEEIREHQSWKTKIAIRWTELPDVAWQRAAANAPTHVLPFLVNVTPEIRKDAIVREIMRIFRQHPRERSKLVTWTLPDFRPARDRRRAERWLNWLWDGTRSSPASDDLLARSMGTLCALASPAVRGNFLPSFRRLFGDTVVVQFGRLIGPAALAVLSRESVLAAIRPDIKTLLKPTAIVPNDANAWLRTCPTPKYLFDFESFATCFVEQVVPTQLLMRGRSGAIFFSPARLEAFTHY